MYDSLYDVDQWVEPLWGYHAGFIELHIARWKNSGYKVKANVMRAHAIKMKVFAEFKKVYDNDTAPEIFWMTYKLILF